MVFIIFQILFAKTYGGISNEGIHCIIQTQDGGYVMAGFTDSFGAGETDILVIKVSPGGKLQWAKAFGGSLGDHAWTIVETQDRGYIIGGYTSSFGAGQDDFLLIKISPLGHVEWAKTFGGPDNDRIWSITPAWDGDYIASGQTYSFGKGSDDFLLVKFSPSGDVKWIKTFGGDDHDHPWCIKRTKDKGYIIAGVTWSFGAGEDDIMVVKLDSTASVEWVRVLGSSGGEGGHNVIQSSDGGYVIAGWTDNFGAGETDIFVIKLSSEGSLEWAKTFGGSKGEGGYSVTQSQDGGYVIAGWTNSFGEGDSDFFIFKLSSEGSLEWAKTFGGPLKEWLISVKTTSDGGYIAGGDTESFGAGGRDFLILKIDSEGEYPECVKDCIPVITSPSPSIATPTLFTSSPSTGNSVEVNEVDIPFIKITDVCTPFCVENKEESPGLSCRVVSGRLFFSSQVKTTLRLYSIDGRLIYSTPVDKNGVEIKISRGVYLWFTGNEKGKVIIR